MSFANPNNGFHMGVYHSVDLQNWVVQRLFWVYIYIFELILIMVLEYNIVNARSLNNFIFLDWTCRTQRSSPHSYCASGFFTQC